MKDVCLFDRSFLRLLPMRLPVLTCLPAYLGAGRWRKGVATTTTSTLLLPPCLLLAHYFTWALCFCCAHYYTYFLFTWESLVAVYRLRWEDTCYTCTVL